ncbi:MAG: phosphoribosylanthranilate isomerase [Lysobacterales bacterium]
MNGTRVKICGVTRLQDLQAAVAAGADALGFVFTPRSRRFLELAAAAQLVAEVPAFVSRVGLFMDQDRAEVARVLERVPLSLLQFHGREDAAFCRQFGLPYMKAFGMASAEAPDGTMAREVAAELTQAERDYADAAALLLDSHGAGEPGGTGRPFDWAAVPRLSRPLVLAGGLTPDNVRAAVRAVRPWAVDVSSGVEDAPGIKCAQKMQAFISEAKCEY